MADMLRVNINVISTLNADTPLIEPADHGQNLTMLRPTCNLGLIGQTHYVSLEKVKNHVEQESTHTDEMEITEFETNCKLRGLPFNTCLQPEQLTGNQVISIAPGEGQNLFTF